MGSNEAALEARLYQRERSLDAYDEWEKGLPKNAEIDKCVREAMHEFVTKEFKWKDFVTKDDTHSWALLGLDTRVVADEFLEDSDALQWIAEPLDFEGLRRLLDKAQFEGGSDRDILEDDLGYGNEALNRIAEEVVNELLNTGDLPIQHMYGQGEHTWTLTEVKQVKESPELATVNALRYTMTDTSADDHKTYFLDVLPAQGDEYGREGLEFFLSDTTGKWKEPVASHLRSDDLTDEVFLDVEKEIEDGELGSAHKHSKTD